MSKPRKSKPDVKTEKAPDEIIHELILQRKLQQEALIKIKTSMDKKQFPQDEAGETRPEEPTPLISKKRKPKH